MMSQDRPERFPSTQWSLVRQLGDPATEQSATDQLCRLYWRPIFAYLRKNHQHSDAEDITQEFLWMVIKQGLFERADASEGKLRSWLLKSLGYFLRNRQRFLNADKRSIERGIVLMDNLDEKEGISDLAVQSATPEIAFDQAWLNSILQNALNSLTEQYTSIGKLSFFEAMMPFLVDKEDPGDQAAVARQLGISHSNFRVQLHRLRKRYGDEVRRSIAATVNDPKELDEELRYLFQISSRSATLA